MTSVVRLLRRIWAFLSPLPNWQQRVRLYRGGMIVWDVPDHPEVGKIGPWPAEWTPLRILADESGTPKIDFLPVVSAVSGRTAEGEDAVACVRCGIHLHMDEAGMQTNLDVPSCAWCRNTVMST